MIQLIAIIIFLGSLLGMAVILLSKIPILVKLPATPISFREIIVLGLKNKIKSFPFWKDFSVNKFLEKILIKLRILTLKAENQTTNWLKKLRARSQKKESEDNHYWEELKKAKKNNWPG